MNKITNPMPTAELQALDADHHMHPFTDSTGLASKGARVITRGQGIWLTDSEGHRILDGMAGLWCVNIGYGRKELAQVADLVVLARHVAVDGVGHGGDDKDGEGDEFLVLHLGQQDDEKERDHDDADDGDDVGLCHVHPALL